MNTGHHLGEVPRVAKLIIEVAGRMGGQENGEL